MRALLYIIVTTAFSITLSSCLPPKNNDDLLCIDIRKNYPQKEILLTDIADITYLCLHSSDENYLYSGALYTITENAVIVLEGSRGSKQGNILVFSKEGTPKCHFNCKGNGSGECIFPSRVFYDEATDNLFVVDIGRASTVIIQVYSSTGKHKREIRLPQGSSINEIASFDDYSFLVYDDRNRVSLSLSANALFFPKENIARYYQVSKEDGAVLDYFEMLFTPMFFGIDVNGRKVPGSNRRNRLIKSTEGVLLCNPENDTIFLYGRDKSLTPLIHKTPLAVSKNPVTYINNCMDVNRYQFTEVYTLHTEDASQAVFVDFPVKYYMRYKETDEIVHPKFLLSDYIGEEFIISPSMWTVYENGCYFNLDLSELKQAYDENRLSGKLKELVATLAEDDNDVIMMLSFR